MIRTIVSTSRREPFGRRAEPIQAGDDSMPCSSVFAEMRLEHQPRWFQQRVAETVHAMVAGGVQCVMVILASEDPLLDDRWVGRV